MTSRSGRACALLPILLAIACTKSNAQTPDADAQAAASAAPSVVASAEPAPSAPPAPALPPDEQVDCEGDVCKVQNVSAAAKAILEKQPSYKNKKLQFREQTTNEQFATIATVPWATKVGIDGCKEISDLAPLAELKSLKELSADDAELVADLKPIAELVDLERLSLNKTAVESLAPLKKLTKLTKLTISQTKVTDLVPVADLTKLTSFESSQLKPKATGGGQDMYWPLQKLVELKHLEVAHSNLTSAYLLGNLKHLKRLNLSHSEGLRDITSLRNMPEMEILKLDDCPITNIAPLAVMQDLHVLSLAGTKVTSLAPLSGMTELRSVDLQRTPLTNFEPLVGTAKALHYLGLPKGTTSDQYQSLVEENRKLKPDVGKKR